MERRDFVRLLAAAPLATAGTPENPPVRVVTAHRPAQVPGMPGPYPGRVVAVKADASVDPATHVASGEVVREIPRSAGPTS